MAEKKVTGHTEPRIFTPPLRELTPETSLGFSVVEFAKLIGKPLYPWQEWLVIHAMEIVGDLQDEWRFRFRYVIVLVARQNGKTHLSKILALWWMYVLCVPMIVGTAQSLTLAEEVWNGVIKWVNENDELADEVEQIKRANGAKEFRLVGDRRYLVTPTTEKGGRSLTVDLLLMDELRTHLDWKAWSAITPTVLARPLGLVWSMSNAGTVSSVVLRYLRLTAHKMLGDPDGICSNMDALGDPNDEDDLESEVSVENTDIGLFEWSAHPSRSIMDEEGWAEANPSLNIGGITSRAMRSEAQSKPESEFKTESLCQWVEAHFDPPFPVGSWEAGIDDKSFISPDSQLYWGVDISEDRKFGSISVCGLRPDGKWHAELVEYSPGTAWITKWFQDAERQAEYGHFLVSMQANGAPVSAYADAIDAIDNVTVVPCEGRKLTAWCARFFDAVSACNGANNSDADPVYHIPQPYLDLAANTAQTKALGDGAWAFNRKTSPVDISPLFACAMAYGQATEIEEAEAVCYDDECLW